MIFLNAYQASSLITAVEKEYLVRFKKLVEEKPDCYGRQPGGHITASAWILHPHERSVLLTHHKKLNKWLQLGGHCDDNPDVAAAALREAQEESGIRDFSFLMPSIFDIDIHEIPNPCVYHYDIRFILQAHSSDFIISEESHNLAWVPMDRLEEYTNEQSIIRMNKKFELYSTLKEPQRDRYEYGKPF